MTPQVNLIAAVGRRGQLGLGGKIPWRDVADMKWFREVTRDGLIVIGKRTYDSVPPRVFLGRDVWIVNRQNCDCRYPEDVIAMTKREVIWVAGGQHVYRLWMPFVRRAFITLANYDGDADTWMPPLWQVGGPKAEIYERRA